MGNRLKLRELRVKAGLSQDKVALKLNIAQTSLSAYERGAREIGSELLIRFADFYHVSVDELLGHAHPNVVYLSSMSEEARHIVDIMYKLDETSLSKVEAFAQGCLEGQKRKNK